MDEVRRAASGIRRRVLDLVIRQGGGYLSQACSSAEILATLYLRILRIGPSVAPRVPAPFPGVPSATNPVAGLGGAFNGPRGPDLDRFVFSPVHYAVALYAALVEAGRMDAAGLDLFNQDGATLEMIGAEHSPGIEVTAGSLGQALAQAAGMALARRLRGDTGRLVVFMSDGELQEGMTWETIAAASFHRLERLLVVVDANGQQCDGRLENVMTIEPIVERLRAFGAQAVEVDGHDPEALVEASTIRHPDRPLFVVARTDPCRGLPLLRARAPRLHYVRFRDDAEREAYRGLLEAL